MVDGERILHRRCFQSASRQRHLRLAVCLTLACFLHTALCDQRTHKYTDGEAVKLWVNKVGPYNNPQETYNYHYLPFCKPFPDQRPEHDWGGLGEALQGNELINSQVDIHFKAPADGQTVCSQVLDAEDAAAFADAIQRHFWAEFWLDDLAVWGFVGELQKGEAADAAPDAYLYTHKAFDISYNGLNVIHVNLTMGHPVLIIPGVTLNFTISVTWQPTTTPFTSRFKRYLDASFFEHKIHWFSIANSFVMVLFLTGLVAVILLRTLRKDYARYTKSEDMESLEQDLLDECGWQRVHGDVFRPPRRLELLAACVGTGLQLAVLSLCVILLTIAGSFFQERGTILTAFIVCYALTSIIGGFISGGLYARNDGRSWIHAMLLTASLFPGFCFVLAFALNTLAIVANTLAAVPFGYIAAVVLLWAFISFPLCLIGTVLGRNLNALPNYPCRVKRIPSPIPDRKWFMRPESLVLFGGLLPFGSIFIEVYFIFSSFWHHKVYYVWGSLLLVFVIMATVTICVTICGTYFLLNGENYHWHWSAFGMSASTGAYIFAYSLYYFLYKTRMSGLYQTLFFLGYNAMACSGMSLLCGSLGYIGAAAFVRTIYRGVKFD